MKCSICNSPQGTVWRNGKFICKICFLSYKHFNAGAFKRALGRKSHMRKFDNENLMKEFLEKYPEVIVADAVGNLSVSNALIQKYLKKFV